MIRWSNWSCLGEKDVHIGIYARITLTYMYTNVPRAIARTTGTRCPMCDGQYMLFSYLLVITTVCINPIGGLDIARIIDKSGAGRIEGAKKAEANADFVVHSYGLWFNYGVGGVHSLQAGLQPNTLW